MHWFKCGSGSSSYRNSDLYLDPGSKTNKDLCGSGSWSDLYVTKSLLKRPDFRFICLILVNFLASWSGSAFPNTDPDPGEPKNQCGSGSTTLVLRISDVEKNQWCGSGMFIPDPGSDFFPSRIPDPNRLHPGSRICIKEFKYFKPKITKKIVSKL